MTLRRDLVLVALAPRVVQTSGVLVLPGYARQQNLGLVLQTGADVTSVGVSDRVIFDALAAEEIRLHELPCVLVPESALDAVVE